MSKTSRIPLPWTTAFASSTTAVFIPCTPWVDAGDVLKVRALMEIRGLMGNFQATFGYETADVDNSVSGGTAVGAYVSSNGVTFPTAFEDVGAVLEGKQKVRFGWMCKLSSGSTLSVGRLGGFIEIVQR